MNNGGSSGDSTSSPVSGEKNDLDQKTSKISGDSQKRASSGDSIPNPVLRKKIEILPSRGGIEKNDFDPEHLKNQRGSS